MDCSRTKPSMKVKDSNTSKHRCPLQEGEPKEPPPECLRPSCHISSSVHFVRKKEKKRTANSELKAPLKLNSDYFFSMSIHVRNKETSSKLPTIHIATKLFPAQSCHGFGLILSSYCQNSNSSHHFLYHASPAILQMFTKLQAEDFLQIPLWVKLGAIYQNREHNFIWKGYRLSNFYSESRLCFHLPLTRSVTIGYFFLPPPCFSFFLLFNKNLMLIWLTINHFSFSTFEYISGILCKKHYYYEE